MPPKFRLANQHLLLTYKSHLDKKMVMEVFKDAKRVEIAHENGKDDPDTPYAHTHIYVDWGKIFQSTRPEVFDMKVTDEKGEVEIIHPNIAPIKGRNGVEKVLNYLSKEDPECSHLKKKEAKATLASVIWACKTKQEALALCEKPSDATGILALYANRPTQIEEDKFVPLPWQATLLKELEKKPDDRTIRWIYDFKGGCGKTRLAKWMHKTKRAYMVKALGGQYHTAPIIMGALEGGWDSRILLVDLTRSCEDHAIYDALEAIKDGIITSTKYMGKTVDFDSPHVVVFANFLPEYDKLSHDRWIIWNISRDDVGGYNITPHNWNDEEEDHKSEISQESLDELGGY